MKIDFENLKTKDLYNNEVRVGIDEKTRKAIANFLYFRMDDIGDLPIAQKMYASSVLELDGEEIERFKRIVETMGGMVFTAVAQREILKQLVDENKTD
jgi:hypothetical protein